MKQNKIKWALLCALSLVMLSVGATACNPSDTESSSSSASSGIESGENSSPDSSTPAPEANAISGLTDMTAICGDDAPVLTLTATHGTVSYGFATAVEGTDKESLSYAPLTEKLTAGKYYICAWVDATEEYEGAKVYATLTVAHQAYADIVGEAESTVAPDAATLTKGYSVKKCACGEEIHGDETVVVTINVDGETVETQTIAVGGETTVIDASNYPVRDGYKAVLYNGDTVYVGGEAITDFTTLELTARWLYQQTFSYDAAENKVATNWLFMPVEDSGAENITNEDIYSLTYENGAAKVNLKYLSAYPLSPAEITLSDVAFDEFTKISFTVKSTQGTFIWFGADFDANRYMISDDNANTEVLVEITLENGCVYASFNGEKKAISDWTKFNLNGSVLHIQDKNPDEETYFANAGARYDVVIGAPTLSYDYIANANAIVAALPETVDENNAEAVYDAIETYEGIVATYFTDAEKAVALDLSALKEAAYAILNNHAVIAEQLFAAIPEFETMREASAAEQDVAYKALAKYLAYVNVAFTEEEKAAYAEPAKVSYYRAFFASRNVIVADVFAEMDTNVPAWSGQAGKYNPNNGAYSVTLPVIAFGAYENVSIIFPTNGGGDWTITCGSITFSAQNGGEGATWIAFDITKGADGYYLTISNVDDLDKGATLKLNEDVVLGDAGITFSLTNTAWGWCWVNENIISGTLDNTGAETVYTVTYNYKTNAGDKQYVQYYLENAELDVFASAGDYTDLVGKQTFIGFFAEGNDTAAANGEAVVSNLVLTARYEVKEGDYIDYEVYFYDDVDGEVMEDEIKNYHYGDVLTLPATVPTKATNQENMHYEFIGWFDENGKQYNGGETIVEPLDLYANFQLVADDRQEYMVTFTNLVGEDVVETVYENESVSAPETPAKEGRIFGGWYTEDGTEYNFEAAVTGNLTLFAKWLVYAPMATPSTEVVVTNAATTLAPTLGVQAFGEYSAALVLTGATAENEAYSYALTMPKVDYRAYSEVSFITVFGQQAGTYAFSGYGTTFVNVGTAWNFVKIVYVGAEGKAVKNTDTGEDIILGEGYYLTAGNTDVPDIWYKYAKLPDAVINGSEALTFNVITPHGWDWMAIRESGASNENQITGVRSFELVDESNVVIPEPEPEQPQPELPASGTKVNVVENASMVLADGREVATITEENLSAITLSGATAENGVYSYMFTMPKINFSLYSEVSFITVFGQQAGTYGFSAYDTNLANISVAWNFVKVIYVGAEGKTVKNTDTGDDIVLGEGYYFTAGNTDVGEEWYTYVKLSDAVVNGNEALTFSVTTSHEWDWMAIRESGSSTANNIVGIVK